MRPRRSLTAFALVSLSVVALAGCGVGAATGSPSGNSASSTQAAGTSVAKKAAPAGPTNPTATGKVPTFVPWATVGGQKISTGQVLVRARILGLLNPTLAPAAAVTKTTADTALTQMVDEYLVVEGNPVKPNASLANQQYLSFAQSLVQGYGTTAGVASREKALGVTTADLKAFIAWEVRVQLAAAKYQPTVSAAQVAAYYKAHSATYKLTAPEVNARHILVKTQAEAEKILAELKKGANFAALAKKDSIDTGSAAQGGNLGWFTASQMVKPFSQAAFATPVNGYVIAHSVYGWHVIQVLGKEAAGTVPPLSQVQTQVQQAAQQAANQTNVQQALASLRKRFVVKVHSGA